MSRRCNAPYGSSYLIFIFLLLTKDLTSLKKVPVKKICRMDEKITVNDQQRNAARIAGFAYLSSFAIVVFVNFRIHDRLIVRNAVETAQNILKNEQLFRIGIVGDL